MDNVCLAVVIEKERWVDTAEAEAYRVAPRSCRVFCFHDKVTTYGGYHVTRKQLLVIISLMTVMPFALSAKKKAPKPDANPIFTSVTVIHKHPFVFAYALPYVGSLTCFRLRIDPFRKGITNKPAIIMTRKQLLVIISLMTVMPFALCQAHGLSAAS